MKKHMKIIFLFLILIIPFATQAQESEDEVLDRLANVDVFAFGGVGRGGQISQGEKDYNEIKSRPTAKTDFIKLLGTGNVQAQCYALTGLKTLEPEEYKRIAPTYSKRTTDVKTMSGCIVMEEPFASFIKVINDGLNIMDSVPKVEKIEADR
jgi:hypothetical protein